MLEKCPFLPLFSDLFPLILPPKYNPGLTSENVAARYGVGRDVQDKLAARSHARAAAAQASGRFRDEIVPVKTKIIDPKTEEEKAIVVSDDDGIRPGVTVQSLGQLRTVFKKDGTTTAGNSSQVNKLVFLFFVLRGKKVEGTRSRGGRSPRSRRSIPGSRYFRCVYLRPRPFSSDDQDVLYRFAVKGEAETERKGWFESVWKRREVGRSKVTAGLSPTSFTKKNDARCFHAPKNSSRRFLSISP